MDRSKTCGSAALLSCACIISAISITALAAPDKPTSVRPEARQTTADAVKQAETAESRLAQNITYQGRLRQNGQLANGSFNINFGLYESPSGGSPLATSGVLAVSVSQGVFTVELPFGTSLFNGSDRWLQLIVNGSPLMPRQKINPTPFAYTGDRLEWPVSESRDGLFMSLSNTQAGGGDTVFFRNQDEQNQAYIGSIFAGVEAFSADEIGVLTQTNTGAALQARRNDASGAAFVTLANTDSQGVFAESTTSTSFTANAVRAIQSAPGNNDTPAVFGQNIDADSYGIGVRGEGGWQGVYGFGDGDGTASYYGVRGFADSGSGGTGYAIYGSTGGSGTRWAGYFVGNTNVTGTLSKGAGSFKIDHPLDPFNKFLYHSFVESPEMMNIYNGQARIDASGSATIQMPDYFQALNRDFRYQLTPIGAPMPNLYIAREMTEDGVFVISGGVPGAKVSWQVTGVREDAFANANRIPVEAWKTGDAVGKLLHPEAFGRSAAEGIDASREAAEARKSSN